MEKKLKSWQGWLLFGGSMVVVFVLGLCVSALMERRAEVTSIFNNRKTVIKGIEARNELFKNDFPREYQTWAETAKTDFQSEFNGNVAVDVLEQRPNMVMGGICFLERLFHSARTYACYRRYHGFASYRSTCESYRRSSTVYLLDLQEPGCSPYDGSIGR